MYTLQGARAASKLGYTNVFTYKEGIPGWEKAGFALASTLTLPNDPIKQLSPEDVIAQREGIWLVDIRDEERQATGVIVGTDQHLPLLSMMDDYGSLPKDKLIVLYDTADQLTLIAGRFLSTKGLAAARLGGGITKWIGVGQAVEPVP